jgi:hypothetical protein
MGRSGASWGAAVTAIAGLGFLIAIAPVDAAKVPTSLSPATRGAPISSWGGASANDVNIALLQVERAAAPRPATSPATPEATETTTYVAVLRIENLGDSPVSIKVADVTLDLCDGTTVHATTDPSHTSLPDGPLPAGETRTGWVAFAVGAGDVPVKLVVPVSRPGMDGARVEFDLVDLDAGTVVAGTPVPSGTMGKDVSGGNVYGGDAYGGDGADVADATGDAGTPEQNS